MSRPAHPPGGRSTGTDDGAILVQVLFMVILGLMVSTMLLSGVVLQADSTRQAREGPQTLYAVESGIHHSIQHIVNAVSQEDGAIEQFRVLAAIWNRPEPFSGAVGPVEYTARVVDVSPNLAFRAFVQKYADVTIEAEARSVGLPAQVARSTYRLRLGPGEGGGARASRLVWQRS